jgi:Fur family ferric uptake transcriptional regulator
MRASSVSIIILDLLRNVSSHFTAQEIYEQVKKKLPATSPSTVYRALERLVESGLVSITDMGTGAVVFEAIENGMHHHLICQRCNSEFTIPNEAVNDFFRSIEKDHHFKVTTNHMVLFGICPICQKSKNP